MNSLSLSPPGEDITTERGNGLGMVAVYVCSGEPGSVKVRRRDSPDPAGGAAIGVTVSEKGVMATLEISCLLGAESESSPPRAAADSDTLWYLCVRFLPGIRDVIFAKPLCFLELPETLVRSTSLSSRGVMVRFRIVRFPIVAQRGDGDSSRFECVLGFLCFVVS